MRPFTVEISGVEAKGFFLGKFLFVIICVIFYVREHVNKLRAEVGWRFNLDIDVEQQ